LALLGSVIDGSATTDAAAVGVGLGVGLGVRLPPPDVLEQATRMRLKTPMRAAARTRVMMGRLFRMRDVVVARRARAASAG
jgi:hypothetical protein